MSYPQHPAATHHIPAFITAPGQTDVLLGIMAFMLVGGVLAAGVFFLWLHSLPERMVHNRVQFDIVAALALLSLFTHIHAFWVAALLIALIRFPEFSFPDFAGSFGRIANSLEKMADSTKVPADAKPPPSDSGVRASKLPDTPQAPAAARPHSYADGHAPKQEA